MPLSLTSAALPLLRRLDPERAHRLALAGLRAGLGGRGPGPADPLLATAALGLRFPTPIGLAAGFDKDAEALAPLARLGFGFLEAGTVTPRPQPGNPRPRLFRLREDQAVINRMGFNNAGIDAFVARLRRLRAGGGIPIPLGANVGINKDGADPERDYPALVAAVAPPGESPLVDYVVINVSSPNTAGLRAWQQAERLAALLAAIAAAVPAHPPLVVKIAPDLTDPELAEVIETCVRAGVAGLCIGNTTLARPATLRSKQAAEAGGLSGAPLFARSTALLARASLRAGGRLCLIGVGGVFSGADVLTKLRAGASLVQLYTGFAYGGPAMISRITGELAAALRAAGFASVAAAVGTDAERLAGIA